MCKYENNCTSKIHLFFFLRKRLFHVSFERYVHPKILHLSSSISSSFDSAASIPRFQSSKRDSFKSLRSFLCEGDVHVLRKKRGKKYRTRKGCRKYRKPVGKMESRILIVDRTYADVNPRKLTYIAENEMPVAALIVARKAVKEKPVVALIVARRLLVTTIPLTSSTSSASDIKREDADRAVHFNGFLCIGCLTKVGCTSPDWAKDRTVAT